MASALGQEVPGTCSLSRHPCRSPNLPRQSLTLFRPSTATPYRPSQNQMGAGHIYVKQKGKATYGVDREKDPKKFYREEGGASKVR